MPTELRRCDKCNKPFVDDQGWKRKCILCWKKESNYTLNNADVAFQGMQEEFEKLETRLREVEARLANPNPPPASPPGVLTQDRIRQLITLVHPDRHNNSATANEVTRWLLSIRKK